MTTDPEDLVDEMKAQFSEFEPGEYLDDLRDRTESVREQVVDAVREYRHYSKGQTQARPAPRRKKVTEVIKTARTLRHQLENIVRPLPEEYDITDQDDAFDFELSQVRVFDTALEALDAMVSFLDKELRQHTRLASAVGKRRKPNLPLNLLVTKLLLIHRLYSSAYPKPRQYRARTLWTGRRTEFVWAVLTAAGITPEDSSFDQFDDRLAEKIGRLDPFLSHRKRRTKPET